MNLKWILIILSKTIKKTEATKATKLRKLLNGDPRRKTTISNSRIMKLKLKLKTKKKIYQKHTANGILPLKKQMIKKNKKTKEKQKYWLIK